MTWNSNWDGNFFIFFLLYLGQSDEYSFIFRRKSNIYNRRQNKLISLVVSTFSSAYVFYWSKYFHQTNKDSKHYSPEQVSLLYPPSFDGRCVVYPSEQNIIDYLKWRQVDCHVNNLYNTTFYALTGQYTKHSPDGFPLDTLAPSKPVLTGQEAEQKLCKTLSKHKHDILFLDYNINYNNECEQFKKGTLLILIPEDKAEYREKKKPKKSDNYFRDAQINQLHVDIISDQFWEQNNELLKWSFFILFCYFFKI